MEMEFAIQGAGAMYEETLFDTETPTAANCNGRRYDEECELDDRATAGKQDDGRRCCFIHATVRGKMRSHRTRRRN
jgi:hypothetical protein